ncbi:hypothetical protein [Streptomyces sp. Ag109_O5-10]|uniref:hypothetical protein n=1 Tax=Streptomyces sp. Ag109_O5-10 TaxID=1855349 RepID=UPI000894AF00|nr:hypothetical protein [Streptomyces sp. Ag109_O5-10]SEE37532.1 hypothetical protein SAMN05216533_2114 [Streptomyces sp. Ag109_O5-10]
MGKRANLPEDFRAEARTAYAFLVRSEGFSEPETVDDRLFRCTGLRFRRADMVVEFQYFGGREPEVSTLLTPVGADGTRGRGARLDGLYTAVGCGPAQDVPVSAPTRRAMLKRVHEHAEALRRLLPLLEGGFPEP